jgi:hypothetical protein
VSTARGHHWVSQTYLARFTADGRKNSRLFVVDLGQRKVFSTTPVNVCKQRDFNRVESDELAPDALEVGLSKFEGLLAHSLKFCVRPTLRRGTTLVPIFDCRPCTVPASLLARRGNARLPGADSPHAICCSSCVNTPRLCQGCVLPTRVW